MRKTHKRQVPRRPRRARIIPADPIVTELFKSLQQVARVNERFEVGLGVSKAERKRLPRSRRQEFERDTWHYLMQYLTTLEAPDFLHPNWKRQHHKVREDEEQ